MREVGCRTYKQSSSGKRSFGWSAMPGERNKPDEIARAAPRSGGSASPWTRLCLADHVVSHMCSAAITMAAL